MNMATITTATATSPAAKSEQVPRCPRCDSSNTKFCYYNNHSLSQPRHFCKACRRYWTRGGTLRNVPAGGGCRKGAKRVKRRNFTNHASSPSPYNTRIEPVNPDRRRQPSVANPNLPVRHQYPAAISSPSPSQDLSSLFFGITDDNVNPTTSFSNADDVYSRFGSDIDQLMQPKIELVCNNQPLLPSDANLAAEDPEEKNLMDALITGSMGQWQANYPFELALNYNASSASSADGASDSPYTYWSNISAMGSAFPFQVQP